MPTLVQSGVVTGSNTGSPFASPVTAGNTVILFCIEVINTGAAGFTVTDNLNPAVSTGATVNCATPWGVPGTLTVCYVSNTLGGAYTVTLTLNDPGDTSNCGIFALEYSGLGAFDGANATALVSSTGWSIPPTGGTIHNANQPALMIAFAIDQNGNAIAADTPTFTDLGAPNVLASAGARAESLSITNTTGTAAVFSSSNNFDNVGILAIVFDLGGPTINTQPQSATVYQGQAASFSVSATAISGSLSYQWTLNGANVSTSSTYTTGALGLSDKGDVVQVAVTDGTGTTLSNKVFINVLVVPQSAAAAGDGLIGGRDGGRRLVS